MKPTLDIVWSEFFNLYYILLGKLLKVKKVQVLIKTTNAVSEDFFLEIWPATIKCRLSRKH